MIQIHINCEPHELDLHLDFLGFMRKATKVVVTTLVVDQEPEETTPAAETSLTKETTVPAPRRSASRARTTTAQVQPDKPQISTGEERVNPQDTEDEQVETEAARAASNGKLTLNDVRLAIKRYGDKFSVQAAVDDTRGILGCSITEIGDDPMRIAEAVGKFDLYISSGQRPNGAKAETPKPSEKVETKTAEAPPAEADGLFGSAPAATEPEPPRATQDECNAAGKVYWTKYGEKAAKEDLLALAKQTFPAIDIKTFADVKKVPGNAELVFGQLHAVFMVAVEENPFNRTAAA